MQTSLLKYRLSLFFLNPAGGEKKQKWQGGKGGKNREMKGIV